MRLLKWLFRHRHKWDCYKRISADKRFYYYFRKCSCGADEIQNAGPMGDKQWRDSSILSRWDWEQRSIEASVIIE